MKNLFIILGLSILSFTSYGQDSTQNCDCKKAIKELNYLEKQFNLKGGFWSHDGNIEINDDDTRILPKKNKHFFYLNNCAGNHVNIEEGFIYSVFQKDIDTWKEYLVLNCSEMFKKYYKLSKKKSRIYQYDVDVKIKNK
jgi:hypothetical protein